MIQTLPFPAKLAYSLISVTLILAFIYVGGGVFIPVSMALLFAILLRPMTGLMQNKLRFPVVLAAGVSVIVGIAVVVTIIYFISLLIGDIAGDWDVIKKNLLTYYDDLQNWIQKSLGISFLEQKNYLQKATKETVGKTLTSFSGTLLNTALIPFFTFLILIYRNLFLVFILKLFPNEPQKKIYHVLIQIKLSVQSFLVGIMIEMGIVSCLTTVGLLIIGMKYAVLLGVITGILNLIPYIGILTAAVITMAATLSGPPEISTVIGVVVVNVIVQIIDNNLLFPLIVSSKVKMNAFVSVISIMIGGQLLGVGGIFLALPITAILKIIFDEIEALEPWGYLIGDEVPATPVWRKTETIRVEAAIEETTKEDKRIAVNSLAKKISSIFKR